MSPGYRCVNYFELCRLCTSSAGNKVNIFSDEGRKKDLIGKISVCLPVVIDEQDKLPKILCTTCLAQVEAIAKFRETCINAQTMLESCLNSSKLGQGGKILQQVYIKDVNPKRVFLTSTGGANKSTAPPMLTTTIGTTTIRQTTQQQQQQQQKQQIITTTSNNNETITAQNSSDFLSSIIQAVGIHNVDDTGNSEPPPLTQQIYQQAQPMQITPQYTLTLDGQTIKANQIQYKLEPAIQMDDSLHDIQSYSTQQVTYSNSDLSQVGEFLKPKVSIKKKAAPQLTRVTMAKTPQKQQQQQQQQKINLVIASPNSTFNNQQQQQQPQQQQQQQQRIQTQNAQVMTTTTMPANTKIISQNNKCYLPIIFKDGNNSDQKIMAQIDAKDLVNQPFLQMKLPAQITTNANGQQIVHLTSSASIGTSTAPQLITTQSHMQPQQQQQQQHQIVQQISRPNVTGNETKCIFTTTSGHNVTISHQPLSSITNQNNKGQIVHHQLISAPTVTNTTNTTSMTSQKPHPPLCTIDTSMGGNSNKVQLTTLQNVQTVQAAHPLPTKSGITIQRIKAESSATTMTTTGKANVSTNTRVTATNNQTLPTLQTKRTKLTIRKERSAPTKMTTMASVTSAATTTTTTTTTANLGDIVPVAISAAPKSDVPTCGVCDKVFKRKEHLAQHMKLHLGLRPFKCDEPNCNKSFSRKEHLMRHVVSHTGKKMFHCEFCQKLFSRKDNLNKHKRSHDVKETVVYTITPIKQE